MNVQGVDHRMTWGHSRPDQDGMQGAQWTKNAGERAEGVPTRERGGVPGVIRLLQEGHFKGVPDVRLRMNFFNQLEAVETAQAGRRLQSGVDGLISRLGDASDGPLAALLDQGGLTEEDIAALASAFERQSNEILERFRTGEAGLDETLTALELALSGLANPSGNPAESASDTIPEIAAALEDAAESPVEDTADLSTTITPAAESGQDSAQAPAVEPEATSNEQGRPEDAPATLREILAGLMDDLKQSVADSRTLPPPSPPQGNGKAYAKFLANYTDMHDGAGEALAAEAPALDARG